MEKYFIIEQINQKQEPIIYEVLTETDGQCVFLRQTYLGKIDNIVVATTIKETKRGWTYRTCLLSGVWIKVFLPRGVFERFETTAGHL